MYGAWPCIRAGPGRRRACLVRAPLGPSNWAGMHAHWPRNQLPCSMAGWRSMHACGLAPCPEVSGPLLGVLPDTPNHHCGTRVTRLQERHACMRLGCTRRPAPSTKPSPPQLARWGVGMHACGLGTCQSRKNDPRSRPSWPPQPHPTRLLNGCGGDHLRGPFGCLVSGEAPKQSKLPTKIACPKESKGRMDTLSRPWRRCP